MQSRLVVNCTPLVLALFLVFTGRNAHAQEYARAFPGLSFSRPVDLQHSGDGTNRLFVVEQNQGVVRAFKNDPATTTSEIYLDVTDRFNPGTGEEGLLGLAFHPDFESNGFLYVYYTASGPRRSVIERFRVDSLLQNSVDRSTGSVVLEVEQPNNNHNGGQIRFGPDGYLYIGLGDGGGAGDPDETGQDRKKLLGSMLRIDVDQSNESVGYGIPADNPFVGNTTGIHKEIYAWGLRNPWRFSFDVDGNLWVGDVGQGTVEEVDIIKSGLNYGWNTMEGTRCYDPPASCNQVGLELPLHEYGRSLGQSITGGFRYRGASVGSLTGEYIFADFASGRIWALPFDEGVVGTVRELFDTSFGISAFGEDEAGELYFFSYYDGEIYKFAPVSVSVDGPLSSPLPTVDVFPNPAKERVTFDVGGLVSTGQLRILDLLGREVFQAAVGHDGGSRDTIVWDVRSEPIPIASGLYLYSIVFDVGGVEKKVTGSFAVSR